MRTLIPALGAALVLVPAAAGTDLIRPGKGIGKVELGMTEALAQMLRARLGWDTTDLDERVRLEAPT